APAVQSPRHCSKRRSFMKYLAYFAGAALGLALTAPSQADDVAEKAAVNSETLSEIHNTNQMEIQAGQLAKQQSKNPDVRQFADQLIQDHQNADTQVTQLAATQGIPITTPQPKTADDRQAMEHQQAMMERIKGMQGADFDKEFLHMMTNGHRHAIS